MFKVNDLKYIKDKKNWVSRPTWAEPEWVISQFESGHLVSVLFRELKFKCNPLKILAQNVSIHDVNSAKL